MTTPFPKTKYYYFLMDHALGSTFLSLYNDNQFKVKRFPEIGYTRGMKIDVIVV